MKSLVLCVAIVLSGLAALSAQSGSRDPFDGTWKLNAARSQTAWEAQPQPKRAIGPTSQPQGVGSTLKSGEPPALLTMRVVDGSMEYRAEYGGGKAAIRTAKFNDATWQNVGGEAEDGIASVTLVKVNDRLHYWVTRAKDGQFAGLIQNRMAADGRSLTSVRIGTDGYVQYVRVFEKQ